MNALDWIRTVDRRALAASMIAAVGLGLCGCDTSRSFNVPYDAAAPEIVRLYEEAEASHRFGVGPARNENQNVLWDAAHPVLYGESAWLSIQQWDHPPRTLLEVGEMPSKPCAITSTINIEPASGDRTHVSIRSIDYCGGLVLFTTDRDEPTERKRMSEIMARLGSLQKPLLSTTN